jgi:hypothetical protein
MPEPPPPIYFHAVASRGRPVWDDDSAINLVLDPAGCVPIQPADGGIPLLISHAPYAVAGYVGIVEAGDGTLNAWGFLHQNRWEGQAVLNAILGGVQWRCSIGVKAAGFECTCSAGDDGPIAGAPRQDHDTPLTIVKRFELAEISLTLTPADPDTRITFGGRFLSADEVANVSISENASISPRLAGLSYDGEPRPMNAFFRDHRGCTWQIDLSRPGDAVADNLLKLAAQPDGFASLLARPTALAVVLPFLVHGPDGELGSDDIGLRAWLRDPNSTAFEVVVGPLAESIVAFYDYHDSVVDLISKAVNAALGTAIDFGADGSDAFGMLA